MVAKSDTATRDDDKLNDYYSRDDRLAYLTRQLKTALEQHAGQHDIEVETLVEWCTDISGHADASNMEGDIRTALGRLEDADYIADATEWHSGTLTLGDRLRPSDGADDAQADLTRREQLDAKETRAAKLAHIKKQIKIALVRKGQPTYEMEQVVEWGGRRSGLDHPHESDLVADAIDQLHEEGYINKNYEGKRVEVQGKLLGERDDLILDDTDLDDIKRTGG